MSSRRRKGARPHAVSKTERWLNLLAFLLDRRYPVTRDEILREVEDYRRDWLRGGDVARESVRRKFERDKRELRELGVVIEPVPGRIEADHTDQPVEAYLLRARDFYLPYLELAPAGRRPPGPYALAALSLTPEELGILRRAAAKVLALGPTPLGPSAASALRKLSFDLPDLASGEEERVLTAPPGPGFSRSFAVLREALERKLAVRCRYYSIHRDSEEDRVIEPYGLMLTWGHWYCIARARDRDAIRVFRLDRMRSAELAPGADAAFSVPPDFRLARYLNRAPWELSDAAPRAARVRFAFPYSRWTIAEGLGRVAEPLDAEGGAVLEFDVRAPEAFVRWLLPFGAQAEVLSPTEFRDRLAKERDRLRALYR
jgi:predicted DNA-binding transcriptional regulator YafY